MFEFRTNLPPPLSPSRAALVKNTPAARPPQLGQFHLELKEPRAPVPPGRERFLEHRQQQNQPPRQQEPGPLNVEPRPSRAERAASRENRKSGNSNGPTFWRTAGRLAP